MPYDSSPRLQSSLQGPPEGPHTKSEPTGISSIKSSVSLCSTLWPTLVRFYTLSLSFRHDLTLKALSFPPLPSRAGLHIVSAIIHRLLKPQLSSMGEICVRAEQQTPSTWSFTHHHLPFLSE